MRRISHGSTATPSDKSNEQVLQELGSVVDKYHFPIATKPIVRPRFTRMFKDLADDEKCLIPDTNGMLGKLSELGNLMRDRDFDSQFNSILPAVVTYFAQFINHDINFSDVKRVEGKPEVEILASKELKPWNEQLISERVSNRRAGMLELDCVYGRMQADVLPPRFKDNHDKMAIGTVSDSGDRPPGKDDFHDVVRGEKSASFKLDRTALIGDRRNDSNLILSQLHVAFLRAHNTIIDRKRCSYEEAKQILTKHYHWLILDSFLPAIVPKEIIEDVMANPRYHADDGLPFEFSVGAFRFGHSMIRRSYYYNHVNRGAPLAFLFTPSALSQNGGPPTPNEGPDSLPENRIIEWQDFLAKNKARQLRTLMVEPLFELLDDMNIPGVGEPSLAVQDLKRGYMMRIPTGQVIANRFGVKNPLTAADFERVSNSSGQFEVLKDSGMLECTPLSYYVLAEATKASDKRLGQLGEVGGRIVAEVLIALLRDRPDSIIDSDWRPDPDFGLTKGTFFLSDFLRLADVL